ncbi:IS5 family transposase [Gallaecimonas sp. GXIMD4217]|uniref:IS5 family transposase n=1 Tax=Gallaecimonas sp. GXIMD4217 TaxID=3131927 RepID=UPI00311AD838
MKAAQSNNKKPKAKYRVRNWSQYNEALVKRGSLTFWLDEAAIRSWHSTQPNGKRGRDLHYSDQAITTALMIQAVFGLSLRATEGFINSLFELMGLELSSPDYSSISKRAKTVTVDIRRPKGPVAHLVFDATGLKVYGEGEWKVRKHGKEKRRSWRKLHLGVDGQGHWLIYAELSLDNVADGQVLAPMLRPLRRQIGSVYADGAYDSRQCYEEIAHKSARPLIPPRSNAGYWQAGHPRNEAVAALKAGELAEWKVASGYHRRSIGETAMWRFKQLTGNRLRLRDYNGQVGEAMARVAALNKMTALGMPVSDMVR